MKKTNENNKNIEEIKGLKIIKNTRHVSIKFNEPNHFRKTYKKEFMSNKKTIDIINLISSKSNKFSDIKLPPLSMVKNINKNSRNIKKIKSKEKTRTKTFRTKEKYIKSKNKVKSKSIMKNEKLNILSYTFNDNKLNLDVGETIEEENKNFIENINESNNLNINENINNKETDDAQNEVNKIYSVFHFFQTNNLFLFVKNQKIEELFMKNPQMKKNNYYEIIEDIFLPPAYRPRINRYPGMPKCIIEACNNGNISIIKNEDNCNLIWKLLPPGKMRDLIRKLGKNQKFNHFPSTYQIGLKDNMYKHIKAYKRLFPKLYDFVPDTYILPNDAETFENIYKKNKRALWIVKPVNMSRGRGVHLLKDQDELKNLIKKSYDENEIPDLLSRYLDKPHIINNKKYDLRIYVLVTSFSPLRFYIYYNGLVRFATEDYQKGNFDNVYIHITNYSINKNNLNYKSNQRNNKEIEELEEENKNEEKEDNSSKWSLVEYINYFKKIGKNDIIDNIWKQIEDIITKSLITVANDNWKEISSNKINSLFELYGYDILIDESFKAWLLEVNVNPSLHCSSPLDLSIKTELVTDIFNIVGILPFNHNSGEPIYNYEMIKSRIEEKEKGIINIKKEKTKKMKLPQLNNNKILDKTLMNIKMNVVKNFNIDNLRNKLPEYENEYYRKMIQIYNEEKERSKITGFTMIFPRKDNIDFYCKILSKDNKINDTNIVLWEYILNNE